MEIVGEATADRDFEELSGQDRREGELLFGLPAALVVLLVFGSLLVGLVPLLLAVVSIVVALALAALVGQGFGLSLFVVNMITGMGLALGIDYSLFVLSRFREERADGRDQLDAIGTAGATASRAVLCSGLAFTLAMTGIVLVPDTILRSLAVGAILVGVVSVVAVLTLLPVLLGLLGDRVNALRLPLVRRSLGRPISVEGRWWSRVVTAVVRRPVLGLVVSAGLLVALAVPVLDLERGFAGVGTLPDRFPSKQGLIALEASFPGATTEPARVVIDGQVDAPLARGDGDGGGDPALLPSGGLQSYGGAIAEVADDQTAFSHRDALVEFVAVANWTDPAEDQPRMAAARRYAGAVEPFASGVYVNALGDEGEAGVQRAYGPDKLARLAAVKARYDPGNVFHLNHNIRPRNQQPR
jgi:uncharacterized membrane protein YdfJ with MMPL/SSD domain